MLLIRSESLALIKLRPCVERGHVHVNGLRGSIWIKMQQSFHTIHMYQFLHHFNRLFTNRPLNFQTHRGGLKESFDRGCSGIEKNESLWKPLPIHRGLHNINVIAKPVWDVGSQKNKIPRSEILDVFSYKPLSLNF